MAVGPLRVLAYLPVDDQLEERRGRLEQSLWYLGRIRPLPAPEYRTVKEADLAMAEANKELKAFMDKNVKNGRRAEAGAVMPESYSTAALDKASALVAQEDNAGAIVAFDAYLKLQPSASDVLVMRAQAKVKTARGGPGTIRPRVDPLKPPSKPGSPCDGARYFGADDTRMNLSQVQVLRAAKRGRGMQP